MARIRQGHGQAGHVFGKPCELRVRAGAGKDPGIAFGEGTSVLTLERAGDDYRPAARGAGVDDLIDEVNKVVWESSRAEAPLR
jgi:hypothetical protein